jgi:peptidoglycan/xylan/chitin deacetylase (PgdA/CDA1 family)
VNFFCYPYGAYSAAVIQAVQRAGYVGASSTGSGLATPGRMYALPRIHVTSGTSFATLAALWR